MKKILFSLAILCLVFSVNAQRLLSWTPEFPVDNSTLSFTVDCNKGNQGLLNFEGDNSNNVYVHVGVITNLSTGPGDWKYVRFTWGSTDPLAKATPLGANKYQYTINNIRTFFGVPVGETIKKVTAYSALPYTGRYISLTSELTCFNEPVAFLKMTVTFFMVSPAGTPKKVRMLLMLY